MSAPPAGRADIWWKTLDEAPKTERLALSQAALRSVLQGYGRDPDIGKCAQGKPFPIGMDDLSFNMSHSETRLVIAVADGTPVGVDCEAVHAFADLPVVARMTLSAPELHLLDRMDEVSVVEVFYALWTRKEALVKAIGVGLSFPLAELTVATKTMEDSLCVETAEYGRWWLRSIEAPKGFAAACACRRPFEVLMRSDP